MGSDSVKKRQVHPALRSLLDIDTALSEKFCTVVEKVAPQVSRQNLKYVEYACHGVPWIAFWLAFIIIWNDSSLYQLQVNFMIGLILDIIAVAVIKSIARRRRPKKNQSDMFLAVGPDFYSFPSGHASRAAFIASFFASNLDLPYWIQFNLHLWSAVVGISRVLLGRHHLLDVLAGIALGLFETFFMSVIWLGQGSCEGIISSLSF